MWQFRTSQPAGGPAGEAQPGGGPGSAQRVHRPEPAFKVETAPAERTAEAEGWQTDLKVTLHQRILDEINLGALETMSREQIHAEICDIIAEQIAKQKLALNAAERRQLIEDVLDELLGLGPIEPLLKDPGVTDILVNTYNTVFVERRGRLELTNVRFKDDRHLQRIITKIVSAVGRRIDESSPLVDARLADGSRVNAVVPPLAIDGALLSIRKFARTPIDMSKLIEFGSVPVEVADVLATVIKCRKNVLISGGTGSGKTTLLNALSAAIDDAERIVTIEDSAELQLQQRHVARLETRPPNIEGRGEITQRDLVKNALRMRPDRIILGEVRAGEAFDMLQAMNTGHDGSMTTVHANTPRDALSRVEQMIGMSGIDIPARSARAQIASAIDVVVQVERASDGKRRVVSVSEITGMEGEVITQQEIFRFRRTGLGADGTVEGVFEATGVRPKFAEHAALRGLPVQPDVFRPDRRLG